MSWIALQGFAWNDYDTEVSAAFKSLIEGNVGGFLTQLECLADVRGRVK